MNKRRIASILFGLATLLVIGFTIYKITVGKDVGFNEVMVISVLLMMFLSTLTWGTKEGKDGILQDEELGQKITEKSSKIGYYLLTLFILVAVAADNFINETINIFLLLLLGLSMITLPLIEFFVAKRYQ